MSDNKITILTLAIGVDYCKWLGKAFKTKEVYARKHGYTYIQAGQEFWDRSRPIAWSKVPFVLDTLSKLPEDALVWLSDADVYLTNLDLKLEDHILPLLPREKDMLLIYDACHNLNSGNILMRNTSWSRDFWKRVNERTDCIYHIWWENMAMIKEIDENQVDKDKIYITNQHKKFNAYLQGREGEPLWTPGDFLVHFAGVYKAERMSELIDEIDSGKTPRL
jgi:hypothetical protein